MPDGRPGEFGPSDIDLGLGDFREEHVVEGDGAAQVAYQVHYDGGSEVITVNRKAFVQGAYLGTYPPLWTN